MLELFFSDFDRWLVDLDVLVAIDGESRNEFEDRFHVQRGSVFDGEIGDLRLADGTNVQVGDRFVEALREQAVDDFLANFSGEAAADDGFRHFAGAEAGNLGVLAVVGCDFAISRGDFIGGHVDDQFAGAFGIEDGTVGMAVLVVVSCFSVIVFLLGFSRFGFAFEGAAGAQDCTFFDFALDFAGACADVAATG